ncbi:hypothetical protein Rhopal_004097-T1 [Rhodotorula paludigena]|uniref:SGF29 C-terminal domain-containing protein n=1 Tax=Rhodotorula paludigena TaxID=86838 RepID=A0AAV5GEV1_9BASI|nr:hypothetical protein Rhopal_004097-T1 [Rhodotorula paludigena]
MAAVDAARMTAELRGQLNVYLARSEEMNASLSEANELQADVEERGKPVAAVKDRLEELYRRLSDQIEAEFSHLDSAMDLCGALQRAQAPPEPDPAALKKAQNKKRKVDGSSRAGSPASSAASPMPSYPPAGSPPIPGASLPRPPTAKPTPILPSQSISQPQPIAPATNVKKPSLKNRKDALNAQLPLKPGRPIAVKESKKSATGAQQTPDNYILGRIVMCLQGDKNRYTVEDVDYDPANPTPEGGKWNTTLKAIIPLPEKGDPTTYLDYEFSPGTYVLACYPETTSFYRAIIQSGPHPISVGTGKKKEVTRIYRLTFDDDEGAIRDVPIELVCDPTPL